MSKERIFNIEIVLGLIDEGVLINSKIIEIR